MTTQHPSPRIANSYRTGTAVFIGIVVLIAGAIAFLSFSTTSIAITLEPHTVTASTSFAVATQPAAGSDDLAGTIIQTPTTGDQTVDVPQSGATVDDYAHGTVTFVNHATKTQALAAGTRLKAASNGLIFKTTARVDIPVNGTVTADVTCSTAGATGNIGADQFEIVALWPGLKDKIYATSTAAMAGGTRSSSQLAQATIDDAAAQLTEKLLSDASGTPPAAPTGMTLINAPFTIGTKTTASAKAGDHVDSLTIHGTTTVAFVAVDTAALTRVLNAALAASLPAGERFLDDTPTATWRLIDLSTKTGTAHLQVTLTDRAELATNSALFAADRFTGKTPDDIRSQLLGTDGVKSATVSLAPFWASKTSTTPGQIRVTVTQ